MQLMKLKKDSKFMIKKINISTKQNNYSIEIGLGIDLYFSYFKFSPEIKYSYGLNNILINQDNIYNKMINKLTTQSLLLSLTFE